MTIKNPLKRVIAGALAVLVMACSVPANADLGGFFGGTDIVASADTSEQIETIATITGKMGQKSTFTGTNVTITASYGGGSNGMALGSDKSATISVADGYIITKAEFTNGYNNFPISRLSSAAGTVTYSGNVSATVSDVNAQRLTVNGTGALLIKQVTVYYEKAKWAVGENINLNGKWFITDDMDITRVHGKNSSVAVPNPIYDGNKDQWRFGSCISIDQYSREPSGDLNPYEVKISLNIKKPSGKSSADIPSGFKIKGGSGTQADPYTFELVYPPKVDVTGVKLDKTAVTIPYGGTEPLTLTATVSPDGATDKTVTWASSDTTVATVDANGKVTAVKAGTAAITATATNGTADDTTDDKTATCTVTVSKIDPNLKTAPAAIEGLTYNGEPQDLITAGTSDDGTVQYAVVETDDDTPEYTLVKRDSYDKLDLADLKVNTIYTPDLEGDNQGYGGVDFSGGNYIIDDITYTGFIILFYNPDDSKYYLNSTGGNLPLPEGIDGLLITDIDSGNVYAEFVNSANPVVEPQIDEQAWVEVIPKETDAGEYDVYYRVKGDDNHNNTKPVKIEGTKIGKGAPTLTDPKAVEGLVEDGTAKKLVTEGSTEDGQLQYALGTDAKTEPESSTFGAEVPEMTKAGTYYVWYRVIGDTNHTDSQAKCITVTISEKKSDDSSKSDSSKSDSSKSDSNSGGSNDGANDSSTTPDTGFNGSVTGAAATLMGAAALAAVSVIAAKKKKEDK